MNFFIDFGIENKRDSEESAAKKESAAVKAKQLFPSKQNSFFVKAK
jgi:hypothetical protein